MSSGQQVIKRTECWVKSVIVDCNFCPFAKRELDRGSIRYSVVNEKQVEACLQAVADECQYLDSNSGTETTLLIFPEAFKEFEDYLSLVDLSEALLAQQDYEGIYQLASFHPDYRFADSDTNDAANYTNRSPYPMLHLIRENSIEKALQHYPQPERIPQRNIEFARSKGPETMQDMLDKCRKAE